MVGEQPLFDVRELVLELIQARLRRGVHPGRVHRLIDEVKPRLRRGDGDWIVSYFACAEGLHVKDLYRLWEGWQVGVLGLKIWWTTRSFFRVLVKCLRDVSRTGPNFGLLNCLV